MVRCCRRQRVVILHRHGVNGFFGEYVFVTVDRRIEYARNGSFLYRRAAREPGFKLLLLSLVAVDLHIIADGDSEYGAAAVQRYEQIGLAERRVVDRAVVHRFEDRQYIVGDSLVHSGYIACGIRFRHRRHFKQLDFTVERVYLCLKTRVRRRSVDRNNIRSERDFFAVRVKICVCTSVLRGEDGFLAEKIRVRCYVVVCRGVCGVVDVDHRTDVQRKL